VYIIKKRLISIKEETFKFRLKIYFNIIPYPYIIISFTNIKRLALTALILFKKRARLIKVVNDNTNSLF
jgi:hypothetical protein